MNERDIKTHVTDHRSKRKKPPVNNNNSVYPMPKSPGKQNSQKYLFLDAYENIHLNGIALIKINWILITISNYPIILK